MTQPGDFYQTLGVSRDVSQGDLQRAYRRLARTYHPDINKSPDAEDRFKAISEAYDVLSDPELRRRYDAFGPDFRQVPPDVDAQSWARAKEAAGSAGPRGDRGREGRGGPARSGDVFTSWGRAGTAEDIDLDSLLGGIFGGRYGGGPVAGADQEAEIELTVEEAFTGVHQTVTLPGGRTLQVTIPPGVTDGQRIRLSGQGGHGGPAGDLYLIVRLAPHSRYRVSGRDLTVVLPLAPWEAALGASVAIDIPGNEAKVRVPPGTSSGRRLRLRGRGLPNPKGRPGDLYAEARIMTPAELTDAERELFESLAATSTFDPRRNP